MTPKEKAKDLVEKIYRLDKAWYGISKQCALIAVDEILSLDIHQSDQWFYQEVKQEIEKL